MSATLKRCPQCGLRYPDTSLFCDQDASALVTLSGWLTYSIVAGSSALLVLAIFFAPALLGEYLKSRLTVEFKNIDLHVDTSAAWPPFRPWANLAVTIHNTAVVSPTLHSVQLSCSVGAHPFANLDWPSNGEQPVTIRAGVDSNVQVKLTTRFRDLSAAVQGIGINHTAECTGPVSISLWGVAISHRLDLKTKF